MKKMDHALSHAQERIWLAQQKYPDSPLFHIGGFVIAEGELQYEALQRAFRRLVETYQALRLRFGVRGEEVFQYETADDSVEAPFWDFTGEGNPDEAFAVWRRKQMRTAMKMIDSPLYRFAVFRLSHGRSGYLVILHHLIADGWSMKLLTAFLTAAYLEETGMAPRGTAPVERITYTDCVDWEQEADVTGVRDSDRLFWTAMLRSCGEGTPRSYPPRIEARRRTLPLPAKIEADMQSFLRQRGIGLNALFAGVYMLYQYKVTGSRHPVIGIPLLGRRGRAEREVFGTFTNTMPFSCAVDSGQTLAAYIASVADRLQLCLLHQKYPYDLLKKALAEEGAAAYSFDVCINCYNTVLRDPLGGLPAKTEEIFSGEQEYALQIVLRRWSQGLVQVDFDYRLDVYDDRGINDLYQRLMNLLEQVVRRPESPVGTLSLLHRAERRKWLYAFNDTAAFYPQNQTILTLFEKQVGKAPEATAVLADDRSLTYRELHILVERYAAYMQEQGVKSGDVVAVVPRYTPQSIAAILAVCRCDAIFMPLDDSHPARRLNRLLAEAGAAYLLCMGEEPALDFSGKRLLAAEMESFSGIFTAVKRRCPYAYLLYTSGTTGRPKGVMISHSNLMNYLWWALKAYKRLESETFALYSGFGFDFTLTSLFVPLIHGGRIRLYEGQHRKNVFVRIIRDKQTTILKITPSHIPLLLDVDTAESPIHTVIVGGENLKAAACEALYKHFHGNVTLCNEYGPTEATIGCMCFRYPESAVTGGSVPLGVPIPNTRIYLLDADGQPVPDGVTGELYIGGAGVAEGYFRLREETAAAFLPDPFIPGERMYKTGDLARREKGDILYMGRRDGQVKIRGNRVELYEVEQTILESRQVRDVTLLMQKGKETAGLAAYVIPSDDYSEERLKGYMEERLPAYMIPAYFVVMNRFPLTPHGKTDRSRLPAPRTDGAADIGKKHPLAKYAGILLEAMQEVLQVDLIREDGNFYALGGDSIKAIQISSRLRERQLELAVRDILLHPVLADMAALVRPLSAVDEAMQPDADSLDSPMFRWFFQQGLQQPGRYNQSILLRLRRPIAAEQLETIFRKILRSHEILRLNCEKGGKPYINDAHLTALGIVREKSLSMEENIPRDEVCFDLEKDLLIRPILLQRAEERYLLIVAHHLVVDGVSWRILLGDLAACITDDEAPLPPEEWPYRRFTALMSEERIPDDEAQTFWRNMVQEEDGRLLRKGDGYTNGETQTYRVSFPAEVTPERMAAGRRTHAVHAGELLGIALFRAMQKLLDIRELLFEMEGHGRDRRGMRGTERTVGWFTVLYPVWLQAEPGDLPTQTARLAEQFRQAGARKYEWEALQRLEAKPAYSGAVRMNYLGEFHQNGQAPFLLEEISPRLDTAPCHRFDSLMGVDVLFVNKRLHAAIVLPDGAFSAGVVDCLRKEWVAQTLLLLSYLEERSAHSTPAKEAGRQDG